MPVTPTYVCGFEGGHLKNEPTTGNGVLTPVVSGAAALETTIKRTGNGSLKIPAPSGVACYWQADGYYYTWFWRVYVRVTSRPSTNRRTLIGTAAGWNIAINPDGTLAIRSTTTVKATTATALTDTSKWYRIEYKFTAGGTEIKIDGVSEATNGDASAGIYPILGSNDTIADTYTAYFDDFMGASGSYPGDGQCVLLIPTSDNAIGANWAAGAGGGSNLYEAVNNLPPIGTSAETDSTQIEHAGGGAADEAYSANMETYSSKGIASGDVINAILPFYYSGEDISTGTKYLAGQLTSNPTSTKSGNIDVGTGGALGVWSVAWRSCVCPIVVAPTVTVGNAPIFTIYRPVASETRVASVCFMGLYVDYTPSSGTIREEAQAYYRQLAN